MYIKYLPVGIDAHTLSSGHRLISHNLQSVLSWCNLRRHSPQVFLLRLLSLLKSYGKGINDEPPFVFSSPLLQAIQNTRGGKQIENGDWQRTRPICILWEKMSLIVRNLSWNTLYIYYSLNIKLFWLLNSLISTNSIC